MNSKVLVLLYAILALSFIEGRDVTQTQRHNQDFLLHESGFPPLGPKQDKNTAQNVPLQPSNPLSADNFPALRPSSKVPQNSGTTSTSGKRDYVAPQWTTRRPSSPSNEAARPQTSAKPTGLRDYVAPTQPTNAGTKPPNMNSFSPIHPAATPTPKPPSTTSKRDYVAPNWPGLPHSSGTTQSSTKPTTAPSTTKNPSFSSIVSGTNKPGPNIVPSSPKPGHVTLKPGTLKPVVPTVIPNNRPNPSNHKPGTVLPSTLVNQNAHKGNKNGPTDSELVTLSEDLLRKDTNNAAKFITVNFQEKTTSFSSEDKAPQPLFVVPSNVWNMPTIQKFLPLLDNYEWDTLINEYVTPQERTEENAFMDAIMPTQVIRHLMNFLKEKGYVTPDPKQQRDFLKQLWFTLYSRGKGKIGSSGFEHIFVSELKNNEVSGLHNWIYFAREESANRVNYLGYLKYLQMNDKGSLLKMHFNQRGKDKPVDTMFIGTSPELEMALYTLCFVTRPDVDCKLKLAGKDVTIVTHTFRYRSRNLIGSAYPQF